jgi:hypothetical protein
MHKPLKWTYAQPRSIALRLPKRRYSNAHLVAAVRAASASAAAMRTSAAAPTATAV